MMKRTLTYHLQKQGDISRYTFNFCLLNCRQNLFHIGYPQYLQMSINTKAKKYLQTNFLISLHYDLIRNDTYAEVKYQHVLDNYNSE